MPVRAVLLDGGGTLFHRVPSTTAVVQEVLARHGLEAPADRIHAAFHHAIHGEGVPEPGEEARAWRRFNEDLLAHAGIPLHDALVRDLEATLEGGSRVPYPDALPALDLLRSRGLRLVVVSNYTHALPRILDEVGVTPRVDGVVYSWKCGYAKPDPRIYALGLEAASVPAAEALMVGDSAAHDVAGAEAAGIRGVLLDREGRAREAAGPRRVRDLRDLVHFLDGDSPKP